MQTRQDEQVSVCVCGSCELWLTFSSETEAITHKAALSPDLVLWHGEDPRHVAIKKTRGGLEHAPHWQLILLPPSAGQTNKVISTNISAVGVKLEIRSLRSFLLPYYQSIFV